MKKLIRLTILVVFIAVFFIAGCAGKPIRVGTVDQQLDNTNIDFTRGRSISASASGFQLLLFIPININNRHERAYQILCGQAGNDYITDIKIQESWTYAFVGTVYSTTIKAMAYPRKL
ncbi:MAG: hypothetical protein KKI12_03320 [Proteobacteria bacterium]|nr:hypothetical protein [Patescibacteria group bacterium]MBU4287184.1 hypothetical protein [Pseudomonadota bacterium]